MVELTVEQEVNLKKNKFFGEWKNRNLAFSSKVEEKALIRDKLIVFWDFGTWCLISGQSRKIRDGWNLWYSNFGGKNDVISLKNSSLRELQVLVELIFRYNFQFSTFILQESSKQCLIFSYFSAVLGKWANLSRRELSLNRIVKEC